MKVMGNNVAGLTHILHGITFENVRHLMTCLSDFGAPVTTHSDGNPNIILVDITEELPEPKTTAHSTQPTMRTITTMKKLEPGFSR